MSTKKGKADASQSDSIASSRPKRACAIKPEPTRPTKESKKQSDTGAKSAAAEKASEKGAKAAAAESRHFAAEEAVEKAEKQTRKRKAEDESEEAAVPVKPKIEEAAKTGGSKGSSLAVGQPLPDLQLVDDEGNDVSLHDIVKRSGVVLYAYPRANTGGCTQQSLLFKELHDQFAKKKYKIFGISGDSVKSQSSWKTKHSFPFHLLSDLSSDKTGLRQLGFLKPGPGKSVLRSHLVARKGNNGGSIEQVIYGVKPKESAKNALACIMDGKTK